LLATELVTFRRRAAPAKLPAFTTRAKVTI
jgi:hypothetical protein